ncbi:helix-turn-helix domain-containing protein [Gloeocapsopsis sp. IPPAS B-1203]|uniref:helix-turn-helix domain-containing protein n=1 Tax=Gloeocapsopsis sp. IPPAS B-1203 TaxID=2049454 RepID=UPI000C177B2D|nr:helix-turn-helix domain-containing protein [Gloeocapsopsis sp. IPPAS B-1203]PIG90457.1 transposase [Gloeocapsopsis sp. IPPAS B-1203]
MAGVTRVEIQESTQELEQRLQIETNATVKERLQVIYLLKLPEPMSISAIAKVMGKHRGTLQRWLSIYQEQGLEKLLEIKHSPGRPRAIPGWAVVSLKRRLAEPNGFKSYTQVQQWLRQMGVEAEYRTVHELVRYRLKAKLKAARPVHKKQDPMQLERFKKTLLMT